MDPATPATSGPTDWNRRIAVAALFSLGGITAAISYLHGLTVVRHAGNVGVVVWLVPIVADLMIVSSSLALLDAARWHDRRPWLAIVALAAGIGTTVAINVAAGWDHGWGSRLINALPPLALITSIETIMIMVRRARQRSDPRQDPAGGGQCPHGVARSVEEAIVAAFLHGRDCEGKRPSQRQLAADFATTKDKVATLTRPHTEPPPQPEPAEATP
jgi:hypothetical protein